ncbi:MAG: HesA/MoeB/ThiF family protein, partial [Bacteroidales bacterium]
KAEAAKAALQGLNSDVKIIAYPFFIDETCAADIIADYDMVVGATDNFKSRLCIDAETKKHKKAFVHASICEFEGQLGVFNYRGAKSYQDLFGNTSDEQTHSLGVLGILPGIVGSMQALEVIKIILDRGDVTLNTLTIYDAFRNSSEIIFYD